MFYLCGMHKLFCAIGKETLFLVRDLPGLAILFLMPLILVFVVTLAQEYSINPSQKTSLLVIDESGSPLSHRIINDIDSSGLFNMTISHSLTASEKNKYLFQLHLSQTDSAVSITINPDVSVAEKKMMVSTLAFIIKGAQGRQVMDNTLDRMFVTSDTTMKAMVRSAIKSEMDRMPAISEHYDLPEQSAIRPSVIQNNVPGFILFAMFFIVIPLSASIIAEKEAGAWTRLMTLPVPKSYFLLSKVIVYLGVCLLQFLLMILMGTWVFPVMCGLDALCIGHQYLLIALTTIASSLAAIGFGVLTGTFARNMGQAALFGSVMAVILGLISGTFFPVHLLPDPLQYVSLLSPIRWGIDNYLLLFIRQAGFTDILPRFLLLLVFFFLAMMISIHNFARSRTLSL